MTHLRTPLLVGLSLACMQIFMLLACGGGGHRRFIQVAVESSCVNGVDDDGDGLVDCADPDCDGSGSCPENTAARCSDGRDNDGDGLVDCNDPNCAAFCGVAENTA